MTAGLRRRLRAVSGQARAAHTLRPEEPATARWLRLARALAPALEREGQADAARRARDTVAVLEAAAGDPRPRPYLEYFCRACLLRLAWNTPAWDGRRLWLTEPDYDEHLNQVVAIERARWGGDARVSYGG